MNVLNREPLKPKKTNRRKAVVGIFLIAFMARGLFYMFFLKYDPGAFSRYGDCGNYINAAKNMLNYGVFCEVSVIPPYPGIFRTPAYPALIALIYSLTGYSDAVVVFTQIILSSLTCVMVYLIASKYASNTAAVLMSVILAVDIVSIKSTNEIMTETLFTFVIMILVAVFTDFIEKCRKHGIVLAGILCGIGALVRPILLYFFLSVPILLAYYFKRDKRRIVTYSVLFIFTYAMFVVPWIYRNLSVGYRGFAAVQEVNIYIYKAGWIEQRLMGTPDIDYIDFDGQYAKVYEILAKRGISNTPYNRAKLYKELGMKTLLENPLLALKYQQIYTARVFTSLGAESVLSHIQKFLPGIIKPAVWVLVINFYKALLWGSYFLFVIGVFSRKSWDESRGMIFILALFAYLAVLSGEWGAESRFRVPLMPLILVISAIGVDRILHPIIKFWNLKTKSKEIQ
ncbi:MAG: glycosyltransferase family 39 protein [Clostridia bacterium]|nr:glycosyltransferase family 39 protein [Clostridia bacterium]